MPKAREKEPIPILYGFAKLKGQVIFKGNPSLTTVDDSRMVSALTVWATLCMGVVKFEAFFSPKVGYKVLDGVVEKMIDYFEFSSTGLLTHTEFPDDIYKQVWGSAIQLEDYLNGLPGVAWFHLKAGSHSLKPGAWKMHFTEESNSQAGEENTASDELLFYLRRDLSGSPVQPSEVGSGAATPDGTYGDNPASVVYDLLTDTLYGLGIDPDEIDLASFTDAAVYFNSKKYGVNLVVEQEQQAQAVIDKVCKMVGALLSVSIDNKLILIALNSPAAVAPVATLTNDDVGDDFTLTEQSWDDTYNQFAAKFTQPSAVDGFNQITFTERSLIAFNSANEMFTGTARRLDTDFIYFYDLDVASERLHEVMKNHSLPKASIRCTVGEQFFRYVPGQAITIVNTEHGINAVFRIKHRSVPDVGSNKLQWTLEQLSDAINDPNFEQAGDPLGSVPALILTDSEDLYFDPYALKSEYSTDTYTDLEIFRVMLQRGDGLVETLTTQYQDPVNYSCSINTDGADHIRVTLVPAPGADWSSVCASNSQGDLYVIVFER